MNRIKIISVGGIKQKFILEGEAEYVKRLGPKCRVDFVEIQAKRSASLPATECMRAEAELISKKLEPHDNVWLLDEGGEQFTSQELARAMQRTMNSGKPSITFVIGGAHGTDGELKDRASKILSLSRMTFSYQLARLVLIEQVYRAISIINGSPYHK